MNTQSEFGHWGEERAGSYLQEQGYTILARNWRYGHKEVDIICTKGDLIVIVEVKARGQQEENPETLLNIFKRRNLRKAAAAYLREYGLEKEVRFDLVLIAGGKLQHIEEAFRVFD